MIVLAHPHLDSVLATVDAIGIPGHSGKWSGFLKSYVLLLSSPNDEQFSSGWDYDVMVERLKAKVYAAVISDDTQLINRAYSDQSCSLHILAESIEPFDLAIAFSKVCLSHVVTSHVAQLFRLLAAIACFASFEHKKICRKSNFSG
jgi:hypothetical protein